MNRKKFSDYAGSFLVKYSSYVLAGILLASVIFLIPFLYIEPEIQASLDPEHEVYDVRDQVNKIFDTPLHQPVFIIESNSGDALTKSVLTDWAKANPKETDFLKKYTIPTATVNKMLAFYEDESDGDMELTAKQFLKTESMWKKWVPADVAKKVSAAL